MTDKPYHKGSENLIPLKPGQTANPNGRPKGKISLQRAIKLIMETPTEFVDPITGETKSGHYIDSHLAELISVATLPATGDSKQLSAKIAAIKELNDRYAGKAQQYIEIETKESNNKYDFSRLTPEEADEFDKLQTRYSELLDKCTIAVEEVEG